MQRRAAAIYFVFFLVVGAAAYAYIGVAQSDHQPQYQLDAATFEGNGSTNAIAGTEYTAAEIAPGGGDPVATLEWTNESVVQPTTLDNGSTTTYQDTDYTVVIANESDVSSFALREELNVTAILRADDEVDNTTATQDDTEYVVYSGNRTQAPLDEYLPAPETREFSVGDSYQYEGNETTVADVTPDAVTLERTAPEGRSVEIEEGTNVTLANGEQYFGHFTSDQTVRLAHSDQYADYSQTQAERDYFTERVNGLWGIVIVALSAAFLIFTMAYMPSRG